MAPAPLRAEAPEASGPRGGGGAEDGRDPRQAAQRGPLLADRGGEPIPRPRQRQVQEPHQEPVSRPAPPVRSLEAVAGRPLRLDRGVGPRLIAGGLSLADDAPCLWNLAHPERVLEVHRLDVEAGADALVTNTFGANRAWLARFGRRDEVESLNRKA